MTETPMADKKTGAGSISEIFVAEPSPPFNDPRKQREYWGRSWGVNSEYGALRAVYMHRPGNELKAVRNESYVPALNAFVDKSLRYYWTGSALPDIPRLQAEHDAFADLLRSHGAEVVYSRNSPEHLTKTLNTRDVAVALPGGVAVMRMASSMRRGEEQVATRSLTAFGVPILRTLNGSAVAEGGNVMFLDEKHAAVGVSIRTNREGIRQLKEEFEIAGVELYVVTCPGYQLFHIDCMMAVVAAKTALVDRTHLPYDFLMHLEKLGFSLIDACPEEGEFAINGLTLSPGVFAMIAGFDKTAEVLTKSGITVIPVDWTESMKNGGGLHCASCPLIRENA